eukprot:COSAG02_NODE_6997_length_3236_cov_43.132930_3_plen_58_part_00
MQLAIAMASAQFSNYMDVAHAHWFKQNDLVSLHSPITSLGFCVGAFVLRTDKHEQQS